MSDIELDAIRSGYNLSKINSNFEKIEDVINDDVLHRSGGNNTMSQELDMNSNKIINTPRPSESSEVANKQYVDDALSGVEFSEAAVVQAAGPAIDKVMSQRAVSELLEFKIFQSPTEEGLAKIQTRTVVVGEVYEVRKTSDNSLATIYSDSTGNTEIVQNGSENVSGGDGAIEFYVDTGEYSITSASGASVFYAEPKRTIININAPNGSDITNYLEAISDTARIRVHLKFPDGYIYTIGEAYTRFTESIIDLGACTIRPTVVGAYAWTNAGQRNKWYNGKFEPLDYSSNYYGMLWTHDETQKNGSFNEWYNPYFAGVFRSITAYMDTTVGSACYSHSINNPQITGVGSERAGSWGICFNGDQSGNTSGNDSRVIGGRVSSFESNLYNIGGVSTRYDKVRSDGGKYAYRLNGGQYNQITGQYTEFNDTLIKLEGVCYGNQMIGGSQASNDVIQEGQQNNNLPLISIGINGIPDVLSLNSRAESAGTFVNSAATALRLGIYDLTDSTLVNSVDIRKSGIDPTSLSIDTSNVIGDFLAVVLDGKTFRVGGEALYTSFDDNGDIDMVAGRRIKGGVQFEERDTLRSVSYEGSYILNETGVYSLVCHSNGVRIKFSGTVV